MIFVRLIYWLFKKWIIKIQFQNQSFKSDRLEKAFIDSNGVNYYKFTNDFDIPLIRAKELQKKLLKLKSGLSDENLDKFLEAMVKALNGGRNPDLARIGHLVTEMKLRQEILIHPDLLMDIVALSYIREDENPSELNKEIHTQKIEQFHKDSKEGLYDFFYKSGLSKYAPYLSSMEEDWEEYLIESTAKIKAMNKNLNEYLGVLS